MNDGGPAFPAQQLENQDGTWNQTFQWGMSLRDWFAGMAITGLLANPEVHGTAKDLARPAYFQADAMLKERTK